MPVQIERAARRNSAMPTPGVGNTELDLVKTLDEIYDPHNRIMRDLRVDDRDLKEFPNFWAFVDCKVWCND